VDGSAGEHGEALATLLLGVDGDREFVRGGRTVVVCVRVLVGAGTGSDGAEALGTVGEGEDVIRKHDVLESRGVKTSKTQSDGSGESPLRESEGLNEGVLTAGSLKEASLCNRGRREADGT